MLYWLPILYRTLSDVISSVSGAIFFATMLSYGYLVFATRNQPYETRLIPRKASWIVWWALDTMTFLTMYNEGAANWQIAGATLGSTLLLPLAFIYGDSGWKKFDLLCACFGFGGLFMWQILGQTTGGIIACQLGTLVAAAPQMKESFLHPEQDNPTTWVVFTISCLLTLVVTVSDPHRSLATFAQPIVFTTIEITMVTILCVIAPIRAWKKQRAIVKQVSQKSIVEQYGMDKMGPHP